MVRKGYGKKDGSQIGRKSGGKGRNKTDTCRHKSSSNDVKIVKRKKNKNWRLNY